MTKSTPATPDVELVHVTPALAREWLTRNHRNRSVSELTVARYLNDMTAGRWQYAADPIRFDADGNLLDGQHRLTALAAVADPELALPMLVVRGLPADTQLIMDQGKRRTPGDQLSLLGVRDSNVVAAGIRLLIAHETGALFRDSHVRQVATTNAQMEAWYATHTDLVSAASEIHSLKSSDAPPSVAFCAAMMFIRVMGAEATQEFFRLLAVGAGEGHPINALDKRLQRIRRERLKFSTRDYLAMFIQAANAWREDRKVARFQRPSGAKWTVDSFPKLTELPQEPAA